MAKQVQQADKGSIRDLTEEAIASGSSDAQLRKMRAELADSLNVGRRSLASVSAYVEYSATEAIQDTNLEGRLSNEQLIRAARLVRGSGTPHEDAQVFAKDIGVTPAELSAAIARYERLYQNRPDGVLEGSGSHSCPPPLPALDSMAVECPDPSAVAPAPGTASGTGTGSTNPNTSEAPADARPIPPTSTEPTGRRLDNLSEMDLDAESGTAGDTANYDFPAKHDWRRVWADYIRSEFGPARLRDVLVICLPGRAVEPEVSKYLAMGVRPENIYCVEGSRRVRGEFLENAARLGVRAFAEPLEQALVRFGEAGLRFDIANFDFHGQHCRAHRRALVALPRSADAIVIYNALGKRESKETSTRAFECAASHEASADSEREIVAQGKLTPDATRLLKYLGAGGHEPGCHSDFSTLGGLRLGLILHGSILHSGNRWQAYDRTLMMNLVESFATPDEQVAAAQLTDVQLRSHITGSFHTFRRVAPTAVSRLKNSLDHVFPGRLLQGCDPLALGLVLWHSTYAADYKTGPVRTWEYLSETKPGGTRSPFCTGYGRMRTHDMVMAEHRPAVHFCSEYIRLQARAACRNGPQEERDYRVVVVKPDGSRRSLTTALQWNDRLELHDGLDRPRAAVRASELRVAMLEAKALEKKHHLQL